MPIIQGSTSITAVNHQSTSIQSVYHGNTQVFTAGVSVKINMPAAPVVYYKANGASSYTSITSTTTITCNLNSRLYVYATPQTGYQTEYDSSNPQQFQITAATTITPLVVRNPTVTISKTKLIGKTYRYQLTGITNNDSYGIYVRTITDTSGNDVTINNSIASRVTQTYSQSLGNKSGTITFTVTYYSQAIGATSHNYTITVSP